MYDNLSHFLFSLPASLSLSLPNYLLYHPFRDVNNTIIVQIPSFSLSPTPSLFLSLGPSFSLFLSLSLSTYLLYHPFRDVNNTIIVQIPPSLSLSLPTYLLYHPFRNVNNTIIVLIPSFSLSLSPTPSLFLSFVPLSLSPS